MVGSVAEIDRLEAATWWGHGWRESPACQAKERIRCRRKIARRLARQTRHYRRLYRRSRRMP